MTHHPPRRRSIAALAALLAAATLTLVACGGDSTTTGQETDTVVITDADTTATDTTETDTTDTDTTDTDTTETDTTDTDTTGTDTTGGVTDACAILTTSQIEDATGTAPSISEPEDGGRRCNYGVVTTWVGFGDDWIENAASRGEELSGLGDRAAHDPRFHQVFVRSGDTTFNIKCQVCSGSTDEQRAALIRMTEDALGNIG